MKTLETATETKIKNIENRRKCAARYPDKNVKDVINKEVSKEKPDVLIVQSGSDLTNLKVNVEHENDIEYFNEQTVASAKNLFSHITKAAERNPCLKKIIIAKQIPRYDFLASNPPGLKPHLSRMYNETLDQLGSECDFKDKLIIGSHNLDCYGGVHEARYRDIKSAKYDAVHMFGPSGQKSYTASLMSILSSAQLVKTTPPKYYDEFVHTSRTQPRHHNSRKRTQNGQNSTSRPQVPNTSTSREQQYTVPTYNRFAKLGDYFPGNF